MKEDETGGRMSMSVLGYDARHPVSKVKTASWTAQERELFLLRPEVTTPLSLDPCLWPSYFVPACVEPSSHEIAVSWDHPEYNVLGFFPSLTSMNELLGNRPHTVIAVTCSPENTRPAWEGYWPDQAIEPSPEWQFLGFDILDEHLTSGLSNCGYTNGEGPIWRNQWAPYLNDHGLFTDLSFAQSFAKVTDVRVKEHAPFQVLGIYLVAENKV